MSAKGESLWRGIALLGFAAGTAALVSTAMLWSRVGGTASAPHAAAPQPPAAAHPPALVGRTATLSRLLPERRAVARIELGFGVNGALDVVCRSETADGTQAACFDAEKGTGTWSLTGATLCLSAAALRLAPDACYELSGEAPNLTLTGPGLLAGSLILR